MILEGALRYKQLAQDVKELTPGKELHMLIEGTLVVVRLAEVSDLEKFSKVGDLA